VSREVADELSDAWRARRSVVIEVDPGLGLDDPESPPAESISGLQPWEWPVDLDLVGERLHHAIWANSVDARAGKELMRWRWAELACRLGARVGDGGADIVLPDGSPALCDGGPLDAALSERAGMKVIHRISLEQATLRPLGANNPSALELSTDQLAAVAEPGGTARIIAPAGSGKTRVLTERARLLLKGWGLPPASVALVAYNTRAAAEMSTRLGDVAGIRVRTFNALGLRLCRGRTTIDEPEVRRLLSELVAYPRRSETDPLAPWIKALGRVRLGLAQPQSVEDELPDVSDLDRVARLYRQELADRAAVDFDEQVTGAIEQLLADPGFRLRVQRSARVLLIDEFQDLTPAHLLLIRLLSGPAGAVFAVGDDDQTIYGYSGATPRWLVEFADWFPGAAMHPLEVNYRCPAPVVSAASNLLTRNSVRVAKVIRAAPMENGTAPSSSLEVVLGEARPGARTAARVRELLEGKSVPSDVAVLARVNASLVPVQVLLRNDGVPVNGGENIYFAQRGGVRSALDWLALATAPAGALPGGTLREAARRPKRGMSASLLDLIAKRRSLEGLGDLARWLSGKANAREADKVRGFADDLRRVRAAGEGGTTADILAVLRFQIGEGGLEASATALDRWSHGSISAHGDDLDALGELADLESDASRFPGWLFEQLSVPSDPGGVTLASIHAVKGREWPHVVVHHATAGLLPHRLAEDLEEERRVFHVALTRCRLSASIVPGSPPSPFLLELAQPGAPAVAVGVSLAGARAGLAEPTAIRTREERSRTAARRQADAAVELRAATVGMEFDHGGHSHEIVEIVPEGARALLGGGPATTTVAFGTSVSFAGRSVVLAHPRFAEAFEALRSWRSERSKEAGKPAFVIFDDKTLRLVAALLPVSESALLAISGIGAVKLETYGDELISIAEELRAG
jgi:DNA helicase-2/ATP-dependent DNA helicase PcrA